MSRNKQPLSLTILDVDYFKRINDQYGHGTGDEVLIAICDCLKQEVREGIDLVGRVGGEEFAILMPDTDLDGALVVAERCRQKIESMIMHIKDDNGNHQLLSCSSSFGVVCCQSKHHEVEEIASVAIKHFIKPKKLAVIKLSQQETYNLKTY